MNSIWEDFAKYIFHIEVEIAPAEARSPSRRRRGRARRGESATRAAAPSSPRRSTTPPTWPASGRRAAEGKARSEGSRRYPRSRPATWTSATRSAATTPAGAARARSTRSATAPSGLRREQALRHEERVVTGRVGVAVRPAVVDLDLAELQTARLDSGTSPGITVSALVEAEQVEPILASAVVGHGRVTEKGVPDAVAFLHRPAGCSGR